MHGDDRNDRERTAHWLADRLNGEAARTAAAVAAAREEQREVCARHIREEFLADLDIDADSACLNAPLDATPLSDRLDELADDVLAWRLESAAVRAQLEQAGARVSELEAFNRARIEDFDNEHMMFVVEHQRAETAEAELATVRAAGKELTMEFEGVEAERDALRATVAEAVERLDEFGSQPTLADGIQAMRLRLVELRAQVEAAEGFEFLARLLAWVEPMTSGYMRAPGMKGRPAQTWHLDDVCAGAKAAVRAMDGAKP